MPRPSVSIVIPAWNDWELTRGCLESLRPTLGLHDQVIVVVNGSAGGTAAGLARYRWVEAVTYAGDYGFAAACTAGAAKARGDVVVFLDSDSLVPSRWLEGLLRPFSDGTVGATGPRSNAVPGPQLLPAGTRYDGSRLAEVQRFARAWRQEHQGQTTDVEELAGGCLAVRRSLLDQVGGFGQDLCTRIISAGSRLVLAHESFVHTGSAAGGHDGATDRPLVAACMIVKDEEEFLADCLASLEGFADEVVIYDTGSSDATVEIARAAGATVVEGYWDDDFSRARNAALDHCSAEWILHIDADERLHGDFASLRSTLLVPTTPDLLNLNIHNEEVEFVAPSKHSAGRLFRRERGHWVGRLHEQVHARPGLPALSVGALEAVWYSHLGYRPDVMLRRGKQERNLRVAEREALGTHDRHPGVVLMNLGNSLMMAGRHEEAMERYVQAGAAATHEPALRRWSLRHRIRVLLDLARPAEALQLVAELRQLGSPPAMPDYFEAVARLALGEADRAADLLAGVTELVDEDGRSWSVAALQAVRSVAFAAAGRLEEAVPDLVAAVRERVVDGLWGLIADLAERAGLDRDELATLVKESDLLQVLAQMSLATPAAADALVEQLWQRFPGDARILAFAVNVAPRLETERALEWSARLRAAGLSDRCPLVARALQADLDALQRLRAVCVLHGMYADPNVQSLLRVIVPEISATWLGVALAEVDALAPALVVPFIECAAVGPERCLALARVLEQAGARVEALAVFNHGFADVVDAGLVAEGQRWLRGLHAVPAEAVG